MGKQEIKDIYVDADYLIFECTEGKAVKTGGFKARRGKLATGKKAYKEPLKKYKAKFNVKVRDLENEIALETLCEPFKLGETHLLFSDPKTNFRYGLFPEYKSRDPEARSKLFYRLRKWALKKYGYHKGFEADDIVSYYARKGHLVASMDKDVYKSSEGIYFNTHRMHRYITKTSKEQGRKFTLIQNLTGDKDDNIPALPKKSGDGLVYGVPTPNVRKPFKVTEKLAIELLDEFGWDWNGVVKSFKSKGLKKEDAILNRQLIGMDQVKRKKDGSFKLKLFKG